MGLWKTIEPVIFVLSSFCALYYTVYFWKATEGRYIRINEPKRCASDWVINAIESPHYELLMYADMEGINAVTPLTMRNWFARLLPCVNHARVRNNTLNAHGRASGWVLPNYRKNLIWVNGEFWDRLELEDQASLLIHECTHLTLGTLDYAYYWGRKYSSLRGQNATRNADTITKIIMNINYYTCY